MTLLVITSAISTLYQNLILKGIIKITEREINQQIFIPKTEVNKQLHASYFLSLN